MKKIGFIGLGHMGFPMAMNLLKAGYALNAFDVSGEALRKAAEAGATSVSSIKEAVDGVDVIITMLPGDKIVEQVYDGDGGIFEHADPRSVLIDSSTINANLAKGIAKKASDKGFEIIDAPVSGGTAGAAAGTLTFIVGGQENVLEKVRPVLDVMGKNVFLAGTNGAGQTAKICNNMLLAIMMIGTSEALNLGARSGLDPKVLSDIIIKSSGRNWVLENYNPVPNVMENVPSSKGYAGGFANALMVKDLGLSQEVAHKADAYTPLGKIALELYRKHHESCSENLDFSSIYNYLKK